MASKTIKLFSKNLCVGNIARIIIEDGLVKVLKDTYLDHVLAVQTYLLYRNVVQLLQNALVMLLPEHSMPQQHRDNLYCFYQSISEPAVCLLAKVAITCS